jgi:hypothetical protein
MIKPRILRTERTLAWMMVVFAVITIVSGYALTKHVGDRSLMDTIHTTAEWLFIGILIVHVLTRTLLTRFDWGFAIKNLLQGKANPMLWTQLIFWVSGLIILITGAIVIISGLPRYGIRVDFIRFLMHMQYDVPLAIGFIVHVLAGVKLVLLRRGKSGQLISAVLVIAAVVLSLLVIYVDSLRI